MHVEYSELGVVPMVGQSLPSSNESDLELSHFNCQGSEMVLTQCLYSTGSCDGYAGVACQGKFVAKLLTITLMELKKASLVVK